MAYTFDRENAEAESRRTVQYFEMFGNRALYMDGWMASCQHGRLPWETSGTADFDKDRWELYDIEDDFSQSEDLAEKLPDKLRENIANLGLFVMKQTVSMQDNPVPQKLDTLININRELAAGLRAVKE